MDVVSHFGFVVVVFFAFFVCNFISSIHHICWTRHLKAFIYRQLFWPERFCLIFEWGRCQIFFFSLVFSHFSLVAQIIKRCKRKVNDDEKKREKNAEGWTASFGQLKMNSYNSRRKRKNEDDLHVHVKSIKVQLSCDFFLPFRGIQGKNRNIVPFNYFD